MFVLYSRNTVIRAYFDKYVDRKAGATLQEVAAALGYTTKNISDAVFQRGGLLEYIRIGPSRYRSTKDHVPGWDGEAAERVLEDHLSGLYRVDGVQSRATAAKAPKAPYRSGRVARKGAADWSHLHFWKAVVDVLYELTAMTKGGGRRVEDIKAKLIEHQVPNLDDRLGSRLRSISYHLGWVADTGANPNRWYLTPEYLNFSPEERDQILSQWDDQGNRVSPVDLVEPEASHEDKPAAVPSTWREYRFEAKGEAFGLASGAQISVEVDIPPDTSGWERLAFLQVIMQIREDLLGLI